MSFYGPGKPVEIADKTLRTKKAQDKCWAATVDAIMHDREFSFWPRVHEHEHAIACAVALGRDHYMYIDPKGRPRGA